MAGPLPKDPSQRRRRNATPGFELLPAEGRQGDAPRWPFGKPNVFQRDKWEELWHLPQAVKWEEMQCADTVALYVIALDSYLQDPTETKLLAEVRQLDAKLGISPKAMLNIRWTVGKVVNVSDEPERDHTKGFDTKKIRAYVPGTPES